MRATSIDSSTIDVASIAARDLLRLAESAYLKLTERSASPTAADLFACVLPELDPTDDFESYQYALAKSRRHAGMSAADAIAALSKLAGATSPKLPIGNIFSLIPLT